MRGTQALILTLTPPKTFWALFLFRGGGPWEDRGAAGLGSRASPTSLPQKYPLVALIILNTHMRGFLKQKKYPLGGPVRAAGFRGLEGGGQGSENCHVLHTYLDSQ